MRVLLVDEMTVIMLECILEREVGRMETRQRLYGLHSEDISYVEEVRDMLATLGDPSHNADPLGDQHGAH